MAQELGKIEKPESENFQKGRKLFMVPLIYASKEAPEEYIEKYELYWQQVAEHVLNLESKIGLVKRVYHESISIDGEDGLKELRVVSPPVLVLGFHPLVVPLVHLWSRPCELGEPEETSWPNLSIAEGSVQPRM